MQKSIKRVALEKPALPKVQRVAAYARVSSGKDAMLHSLSAQVSYYSEFIQKNSQWEYMGVYTDEALSGTKGDRAEFQRLLADCRKGMIDLVITKSISRFARNTVTMLEAVRELKQRDIDVYFEKENIHSLSGDGELMLTILASFAQEESRSVSENCKWRIRRRFQNGELVGLSGLYGYRIRKGTMIPDPIEAPVVQLIFQNCLDGMGAEAIAKQLNLMGVLQRNGGKWTGARVLHLLHNEKLAGNALLQKTYVADHLTKKELRNRGELPKYFAEGTHTAIIDPQTFDRAQERLEQNRRRNNASTDAPSRYPFSGMIVCENCGQKFKRVVNHGRPNWQCTTYLRSGKDACPAKQIPEHILMKFCAEALGLAEFDAIIFTDRVREIAIPESNRIVFQFHDGSTTEKEWQDRSRRNSWSAEARQRARQQQYAYMERRTDTCQQLQKSL